MLLINKEAMEVDLSQPIQNRGDPSVPLPFKSKENRKYKTTTSENKPKIKNTSPSQQYMRFKKQYEMEMNTSDHRSKQYESETHRAKKSNSRSKHSTDKSDIKLRSKSPRLKFLPTTSQYKTENPMDVYRLK